MVNQHSVDYHTSPSGLTSRIHPLILLLNPKGFISLQKVFNFLSNLSIPAWFGKFQICGVWITGKMHGVVKLNVDIFSHAPPPQAKFSPRGWKTVHVHKVFLRSTKSPHF